jgi:hypothetical protein
MKRKHHSDDLLEEEKRHGLGSLVGTTTGEADRDTVAGGWEGTDDATSTAPSDLSKHTVDQDQIDTESEVDKIWAKSKILGEDAALLED